jgi:hypothetical protein
MPVHGCQMKIGGRRIPEERARKTARQSLRRMIMKALVIDDSSTVRNIIRQVETGPDTVDTVLHAGADAFLAKPFYVDQLAEAVRSLFPKLSA